MHNHEHHEHGHGREIGIAFALNFGFTLIEIVGGLLTNSVAILSDALHDLGDSFSLGLAWFLGRKSRQAGSPRYTYGYRRLSLLGALLNALILVLGSLYIIIAEAIPRLFDPQPVNAPGMAALAVVGIIVNGLGAMQLRGGESLNVEVIGWHLLEDVLGWAAVLVVSVILLFVDAPILDPLLSLGITGYILYNILGKLRQTLTLFLQATPENIDIEQVREELRQIDGVQSIHHTHVWSLDGEHNVFSTHLVVPDDTEPDEIQRIKAESRSAVEDLELAHITIEIEYTSEKCPMRSEDAPQGV